MIQQTATQTGNSVGVIIPAELRRKNNIKKGSKVYLEELPQGGIRISGIDDQEYSVTPEFLSWLDGFNKEYGKTLQELANK